MHFNMKLHMKVTVCALLCNTLSSHFFTLCCQKTGKDSVQIEEMDVNFKSDFFQPTLCQGGTNP